MPESFSSSEEASHSDVASASGSERSCKVEMERIVSIDLSQLSPRPSSRVSETVELSPLLFSLILVTELFTTSIVILLILLRDCPSCTIVGGFLSVQLVFVCTTVVRVIFWTYISYRLAGRRFWRAYVIIDNLTVMLVLSSMAYGALNFSFIRSGDISVCFGVACFFMMVFTLAGHFRNLMIYAKWTRTKIVLYKIERIIAVLYYMGLGLHTMTQPESPVLTQVYKDLYLMFIYTKLAFLAEIVFTISRMDGTEWFSIKYQMVKEV